MGVGVRVRVGELSMSLMGEFFYRKDKRFIVLSLSTM